MNVKTSEFIISMQLSIVKIKSSEFFLEKRKS